tara:strand:- start:16023 stop:16370 length:348 start_codon:yes stop_codon:yes gene_type:complete
MAKNKNKSTKGKGDELVQELKLKTAEAALKQCEVDFKNLEIIEKTIEIDEQRVNTKLTKDTIKMDRISCLTSALSSWLIDDVATTIGSETKFKNAFDEGEQSIIKGKILKLINDL